jgi:hypothetical protein
MGARGPQPVRINWDEFDNLVSYQCTQEEIAHFFGICVDTLDAACIRDRGEKLSELWNKKRAFGKVRLRKAQMALVEKGGPGAATMAIYLDKKMFPLERVDLPPPPPEPPNSVKLTTPRSFEEFCEKARYPRPFPKQVEMVRFGMTESVPRLILGARGYGKTDYVTIAGVAYETYCDWFEHHHEGKPISETTLIISKSKIRNAAMLQEIAMLLKENGVELEKENSNCVRVAGIVGKDHSVEAVTIKTTLRGRHPKRVVMDDPVTEEDVSEATRVLVKRKYNEIMKLCSNVVIIGQPAHQYDLYADLRGIVKTIELPYGSIPELDHDLEAQRLAGVDEASISASYYLKVMSEGTTPFNDVKYLDHFPIGESAVAFIDPSEGGDYTAISIVRQYMQGVAVVGFVYKRAWNHCLDQITTHLQRYHVRKLAFETNCTGEQPVEMLRALWPGLGVVGRRANNNKHSRIMAAGAFAHLIHLSKESDRLYLDHVTKYEYKSKFDDAPDSLASCLEWIGLIRGKR